MKTADSLDHLVVDLGTVDLGSIPGRTPGVYPTFYAYRLRPEVQPLAFLYATLAKKDTPFVYLPLKKWGPFHSKPSRHCM